MHTLNNTRSSLFLIELIISILFFSLGSAVCVQAFVKAHTTTAEARDLSFASSTVSSAASVVRYGGDTLDGFQSYFPGAFAEGEGFAACYDGSFAPCDAGRAVYTLRVRTAGDGANGATAHIWMDGRDGQTIYELELRYPAGA